MRRLEETRANYKAAIGQGHINPTILESRTETEAQPASLAAEARRRVGIWSISRLISASVRRRRLLLPRLPPFGELEQLELMRVDVWH